MKKQGVGSEIDPGTSDMMMSATKKAEKKVSPPKATPSSYPEMKPVAVKKAADFKATIEKVQKQLDKVNKMDPIAKAKVTCEMGSKLGPILGTQVIKEPYSELESKEVSPEMKMTPVDQMRKAWEGSIDILKADMETWMPGLNKATSWGSPGSWENKGVNQPLPTKATAGWKGDSQSEAGVALRHGKIARAKEHHKQTLSEIRSAKKPKLD